MMQDVAACTHDAPRLEEPLGQPLVARRILCVTDLTDRSSAAERRASLLAEQINAEVLFVHATPVVLSQRVRRLNFARAHVQLLSRADRAMSHAPRGTKVSVRNGTLIQAIKEAACEWEPDLIVMARPRQRALDLILGTTAERVIRATGRPVLIVNATTRDKYRNVLLATDMSGVSVHVARTLMSMGMLEEAYTWIVHPLDAAAAYRQQWRRVLGAELLQRMSAEGVDLSRVDVVVEPARAIAAIQKSLQTAHPELLVIGTGRRSRLKRILFESVADHVAAACGVRRSGDRTTGSGRVQSCATRYRNLSGGKNRK